MKAQNLQKEVKPMLFSKFEVLIATAVMSFLLGSVFGGSGNIIPSGQPAVASPSNNSIGGLYNQCGCDGNSGGSTGG